MHKIFKIVALVLSLAGIVSLIRIISAGDTVMKDAAATGDTALVEPMAWIAYIILALVLAFVVFFVIKNLFTNSAGLKNTLIGLGGFLLVAIISYVISSGVETPMRDGKILSASGAKLVSTGLNMFYILAVLAIIAMLGSGVKKLIK